MYTYVSKCKNDKIKKIEKIEKEVSCETSLGKKAQDTF
jgi:hypothetical protein